jgi:hypothetical protein
MAMSNNWIEIEKPLPGALRNLANELRAVYGARAPARALTIAEAIAVAGNDELSQIWREICQMLIGDMESPDERSAKAA